MTPKTEAIAITEIFVRRFPSYVKERKMKETSVNIGGIKIVEINRANFCAFVFVQTIGMA